MSVSTWTYAIIGLRVAKEDLFEEQTTKAFDHDYNDPEMIYCPKTARKLYTTTLKIKPIVLTSGKFLEDQSGTINGYSVRVINSYDQEEEFYFVQLVGNEGDYKEQSVSVLKPPDQKQVERFKSKMMQAKLWKEDNFGFWSVKVVS